jgi:hypothetical protein
MNRTTRIGIDPPNDRRRPSTSPFRPAIVAAMGIVTMLFRTGLVCDSSQPRDTAPHPSDEYPQALLIQALCRIHARCQRRKNAAQRDSPTIDVALRRTRDKLR